MLKIYNTLAREKQEFVPIEPGQGAHVRVRHDGLRLLPPRARALHDRVRRRPALAAGARATHVTYVRNITDIDDKIIKRAQENREPIESAHRALHPGDGRGRRRARRARSPISSRARPSTLPGMLEMIAQLEARGLAYTAASGDVNYAVRKFPGYGKLSGKSLDELRAGRARRGGHREAGSARFRAVEEGEGGRAVLGVAVGAGAVPAGTSSARSCRARCSGTHFDIHGGGQDLQFPHHENEIAQSEGAHRRHVRQLLDAQRLRPRRQREDVEVARQLLHRARGAGEATTPRSCASSSCARTTAARSTTPTSISTTRSTR